MRSFRRIMLRGSAIASWQRRTDAITRTVAFLRLLRLITGYIGSGLSGG